MNQQRPLRVLVYGKDARSDAILDACARSKKLPELYAYSQFRSPGFLKKCVRVDIGSLTDVDRMIACARAVEPDLVIVGPEEPLEAGLVDKLEELQIPTVGPSQVLARLETSKAWTRSILAKYRIPGNPAYRIFSNTDGLSDYCEHLGSFVVKPDGLTGGKGVRVFGEHLLTLEEAITYTEECLRVHPCVVVEERLEGEEFSLQSLTDGEAVRHCPIAQDHKRAYENDRGPNTGGMGSYSCANFSLPFLRPSDIAAAKQINEAVARALREETGLRYRGVLYGGFIATAQGVRLIEYNARFADPESMNVLPILKTDFIDVCQAIALGTLASMPLDFHAKATVCKYVVPSGYPVHPESGQEILVPRDLAEHENLRVYYAAVQEEHGRVLLTGSRAVALVGIADGLDAAQEIAEQAALRIIGPVRHRADIGTQALVESRVDHMMRLNARPVSGSVQGRRVEQRAH